MKRYRGRCRGASVSYVTEVVPEKHSDDEYEECDGAEHPPGGQPLGVRSVLGRSQIVAPVVADLRLLYTHRGRSCTVALPGRRDDVCVTGDGKQDEHRLSHHRNTTRRGGAMFSIR